jgi:hypothetical protein
LRHSAVTLEAVAYRRRGKRAAATRDAFAFGVIDDGIGRTIALRTGLRACSSHLRCLTDGVNIVAARLIWLSG